jgi:hypothetical protein
MNHSGIGRDVPQHSLPGSRVLKGFGLMMCDSLRVAFQFNG